MSELPEPNTDVQLILVDGRAICGTLLVVSDQRVMIQSGPARMTFKRSEVKSIASHDGGGGCNGCSD